MFNKAGFYFVALLILAVIGFWIPWYSQMFNNHSFWVNFHAIAMTSWLLLLISQAFLMRSGRRKEHRTLGRVSYILGPLCILSFPLLAISHFPPEGTSVPLFRAYILWLQLGLGALFAWFFIAAIYHRKNAILHSRYMIATAFTLIDPIIARYIIFYGPSTGGPPDMNIAPVEMQYVSYVVLNILLAVVLFIDRKDKNNGGVFVKVFLGFMVFEVLTFTLATSTTWVNMANWMANL
jgi:hypothetical protein